MARQLWLLRHGEAEPHGGLPDEQRALTKRGERQSRAAGMALMRMKTTFDAILVSPKVRARQTAELLCAMLGSKQHRSLEVHPPLAGGFDAGQALDAIAGIGSDAHLMLVGHEPDLSEIAGELTGVRLDLKKGGLAAVRLNGAGGELILALRPRELALIAGVGADEV